jgi:hypothetical protein
MLCNVYNAGKCSKKGVRQPNIAVRSVILILIEKLAPHPK